MTIDSIRKHTSAMFPSVSSSNSSAKVSAPSSLTSSAAASVTDSSALSFERHVSYWPDLSSTAGKLAASEMTRQLVLQSSWPGAS